ncbi:MAG TPA: hypothetical protein VJB13_04050 [Candidatus Nanoarchaeia archaeon]|nr:hypothetical protein [Candidatus Nanoarchaeia archaeon]
MESETRKYYWSWQQVALMGMMLSFTGLGVYGAYNALIQISTQKPQLIQRNVLGNEQPEIFVEVNGVKYYSHVDGKDISDLVKK